MRRAEKPRTPREGELLNGLVASSIVLATTLPVTREEGAAWTLEHRVDHAPFVAAPGVPHAAAPSLTHAVYGYYPDWMGDDFSSLRFDLLTHVAYFTGGCSSTGTYSKGSFPFDALAQEAHAHGTKVLLVVPCFGETKLHMVLSDAAKRQAFIDAIVAALGSATEPIDGVDLDFEGMDEHHLADLPQFAAALPAVDWSQAYDYPALAGVLDWLIIMGYGYHWSGGDPGPVAPLDYAGAPWTGYSRDLQWSMNDYQTAIADPLLDDKVLLGLPYYGYDWPSVDFSVPGEKTANATARIYKKAVEIAGDGAEYDAASQTKYFFYDDAGTPRQLWFDDAETLAQRYEAAKGAEIGGIAIWALLYDGGSEQMWSAIDGSFSSDPAPTPTPNDVDPGGPKNPFEKAGDRIGSGCSVGGGSASASPLVLLTLALLLRRRR